MPAKIEGIAPPSALCTAPSGSPKADDALPTRSLVKSPYTESRRLVVMILIFRVFFFDGYLEIKAHKF
jgi:hypothetical protein